MFSFIFAVHLTLCVILIGLVLVQQGKGADMGATFGGGGSNTMFGASGATSVLGKATTGLAVAFMVTSILLVRAYGSMPRIATSEVADPLQGSVMGTEAPVADMVEDPEAAVVQDEETEAAADEAVEVPVEDTATVDADAAPVEKTEEVEESATGEAAEAH